MNDVLERVEYNNVVIEAVQDNDPLDPRSWDNLGTMVCWHKRYTLGDTNTGIDPKDYDSAEELFNHLKSISAIVMPLYLYDHSGISMSTSTYAGKAQHASWDSGLVGYIYIDREELHKEGLDESADLEAILRAEVDTYDRYLRGDMYGYRVVKNVKCDSCGHTEREVVDSCFGYESPEEALQAGKEVA